MTRDSSVGTGAVARVLRQDRPGDVDGVVVLQAVDASGAPVPGPRVAIVGATHGNERVGIDVLARLQERADAALRRGALVLVLSNLDAMAIDRRHTPDGVDMNRLWDADRLARLAATDDEVLCSEERRVRRLAPLLLGCDAILDLHSTSRPSPPHLIFRDDLAHARIAARLGVARLVTGVLENDVLDGGILANIGLRAGERGARLGFTLEAGQHGNPANLAAAWRVTLRLLDELGVWVDPEAAWEPVDYEVYDILIRIKQAPRDGAPWRFAGFDLEPAGARLGPARALASFEEVEADEVILRREPGDVWRASGPFTMLMPAPTAGPGEDLFFITQRRHSALVERSDDPSLAVAEARAIERMLDLQAWDEAQRGVLQVTFDPVRALDLAADLVARTTRLPACHPHRRITVVGRGGGADEGEARAASRWHAAITRALDEGVDVSRIQLVRGASLDWLRRALDGELASHVSVSTARSTTLSLVVVGDPELALSTGELRHVGVAWLIEASSVEADGDEVTLRTARAALVGARPALVRASAAMVRALRHEHELGLEDLRDVESPKQALTARVLSAQVAAWREALATVVTRRVEVPKGALGAWLARVITETGVFDPDTLRRWLVEPTPTGWLVDPERLRRDPPTRVHAIAARGGAPVLVARDVDADSLERWIGWKRTLREVQALPGMVGRDVRLSFDGAAIRRRLTSWLDDVLERAASEPGRWLVVITGDGLAPGRDGDAPGLALAAAHARVLRDGRVRVLRVQHVPGLHLSWWRSVIGAASSRSGGSAPVALGWESEHGGSVQTAIIARRDDDEAITPWSLEPWTVERCLVLVTDPVHDVFVSMLTERKRESAPSSELVHFARTHVERLVRQTTSRISVTAGPFARVGLDGAATQLIGDRVARARVGAEALASVPEALRAGWLRARLGLADPAFAEGLASAALTDEPTEAAARRIWSSIPEWPPESTHKR